MASEASGALNSDRYVNAIVFCNYRSMLHVRVKSPPNLQRFVQDAVSALAPLLVKRRLCDDSTPK